jgi:hypothetical protein
MKERPPRVQHYSERFALHLIIPLSLRAPLVRHLHSRSVPLCPDNHSNYPEGNSPLQWYWRNKILKRVRFLLKITSTYNVYTWGCSSVSLVIFFLFTLFHHLLKPPSINLWYLHFAGLLCHLDDACTSSPCQAGANCDTSPINGSYTCSCTSGYKGVDCSEDIDECEQGKSLLIT